MLCDLHLHTNLSDGLLSLKEIQDLAAEKFTQAGIADHISPYHKIRNEKSFQKYFKALADYDFLKGGEICLGADLAITAERLQTLDYLIGSVHSIRFEEDLSLFFFNSRLRFPDVDYFIKVYTERIVHFLESVPMDILGHPTLLPLFLQGKDPDTLFSQDQIEEIVSAGVKNNVAFEISSRWQVPSEKFLVECKGQGARLSFGSDAHSWDLAFNFDYPLVMMEKLGLDWDLVFVPKKKQGN
jgi:histidinol phosphatase-like PHP family hydrolase